MEVFCFVKKKNESTIKSVKNLLRNKTKQNKKTKTNKQTNKQKNLLGDVLGGPVVKNPPASAGDTGSIPGPG